MFARETHRQLVESYTSYPKEAAKNNGRWAMIEMLSLLSAYVTTGQIIPGFFKFLMYFAFNFFILF